MSKLLPQMEPPQQGELIRSFVALELPDHVRKSLAAIQAELQKAHADVKWISPGNIHLTLAFLGQIAPETARSVACRLDVIAASTLPFSFHVSGLGTLGKRNFVRVICANITAPCPTLEGLHDDVSEGMSELGFSLENRAFRPHLTLGRVRSARGLDTIKSLIDAGGDAPFGQVQVTRILLLRSDLRPGGPEYSCLHESTLSASP